MTISPRASRDVFQQQTPIQPVKRKKQLLSPNSIDQKRVEDNEIKKRRRIEINDNKQNNQQNIFEIYIDYSWTEMQKVSVIRLKAELKSHKVITLVTKKN